MRILFAVTVIFILLAPVVVAQDQMPPDWQATADVAQWRANSAQATANSARVQATAQAATSTAQAQAQATAASQRATAQASATLASQAATEQAQVQATAQAIQATETARHEAAWSGDATATAASHRARATTQAYLVERERLATERAQEWGRVSQFAGLAALLVLVVLAVGAVNRLIPWALTQRQRMGPPVDVLDADWQAEPPDDRGVQVYLLPGGGE